MIHREFLRIYKLNRRTAEIKVTKSPWPVTPSIDYGPKFAKQVQFFVDEVFARLIAISSITIVCTFAFNVSEAQTVDSVLNKGNFGPFIRSLNTTEYGYSVVRDPTEGAPTEFIERFEVRPGDCVDGRRWGDCQNDRERSELSEQRRPHNQNEIIWYGWSFFIPHNWMDVSPTKTTIAQFHQEGAPPTWMFLNHNGGLVLDDQSTGRSTRYIPLISEEDFENRWHKVEVQARWATDETGLLQVWINGSLRYDHRGPTTQAESTYFRYGVYRSFLSRYRNVNNGANAPTQIAFFANVMMAQHRNGLSLNGN